MIINIMIILNAYLLFQISGCYIPPANKSNSAQSQVIDLRNCHFCPLSVSILSVSVHVFFSATVYVCDRKFLILCLCLYFAFSVCFLQITCTYLCLSRYLYVELLVRISLCLSEFSEYVFLFLYPFLYQSLQGSNVLQ